MVNVITLSTSDGLGFPVFLADSDSGYTGKDVIKTPGVYEETTGGQYDLVLAELVGTINGYSTKGLFLIFDPGPNAENLAVKVQDITATFKQYVAAPETAVKTLLQREDEEMRSVIEGGLESLRVYETLTTDSKVFLPVEALRFFDEATQVKMRSNRQVYVLKSVDNQEIVQANCTATYGIPLPDVEEIHSSEDQVSALDILRVIAPCRQEVAPGVFRYDGIYHTPYFKVDSRIRGTIVSHLSFLTGNTRNDTLEIQPNERHMYDNLYTLVCADVARYVAEIMTGIFLSTRYGQKIHKCVNVRQADVLLDMVGGLTEDCPEGVTCNVSYSDVQAMTTGNWNVGTTAILIKKALTVSEAALENMLENLADSSRRVDVEHLPFVLDLSDEACEKFTSSLIDKGVITKSMFEYLILLCQRAYEVNWGHTGATKAIPHFVTTNTISVMDGIMSAYLGYTLAKAPLPPNVNIRDLYSTQYTPDDSDEDLDSAEDEIFTNFDYYITQTTAQKVMNNSLPSDYFAGTEVNVSNSDDDKVEYWRRVNGEQRLYYFLSTSFLETGDVKVLLDAFIKLMRWGSVKPAMLVFERHADIKTVFDLNKGMEMKNTSIVNESDLILVNGCKYTMGGFIYVKDLLRLDEECLAGCLLVRNYGDIQKSYIASLVDIGEMVAQGTIDVAELKGMQQFNLDELRYTPDMLGAIRYEFFNSERNVKNGAKYGIKSEMLNELALLMTPDVMRSVEYIKSKGSKMVVTARERQYAILTTYSATVRKLYPEFETVLSDTVISTVDFNRLAKRAYEIFCAEEGGQAPDANTANATKAISNLNLDLGVPGAAVLQFSSEPLEGKFTIISDTEMNCTLPPIEFSDPRVQNVAKKVRNRVVMLMLELPNALILCRKDIGAGEIRVVDGKVSHKRYTNIAPVMQRLLAGGRAMVTTDSAGTKKEARLHESLKGLV